MVRAVRSAEACRWLSEPLTLDERAKTWQRLCQAPLLQQIEGSPGRRSRYAIGLAELVDAGYLLAWP